MIEEAEQYGSIDGIFNLAACLRDGMLENQTVQWFKESAAAKSDATIHLDEITRKRGLNLKYFVVFSSVSCGRGNPGQSNYGLSNSVMERIIEKRVSDELSGKAIEWGAIGEVGQAAAMTAFSVDAEIAGTVLQRISSCLNVLDTLLTTTDPIVASMVVAKKRDTVLTGKKESLIEMVLNIMSIQNTNSISMNTSLAELGVDSLMTIEIKQALEREFEIYLSNKDLRAMTFQTLQTLSEAGKMDNILATRRDKNINEFFNFSDLLISDNAEHETIYRLQSISGANVINERVLIFAGIEGDSSLVWHSVGKQIHVPTFIANYRSIWTENSVLEMAKIYAKVSFHYPYS